jgi:hypothetical protein
VIVKRDRMGTVILGVEDYRGRVGQRARETWWILPTKRLGQPGKHLDDAVVTGS